MEIEIEYVKKIFLIVRVFGETRCLHFKSKIFFFSSEH
jgi:hypothetical protein